MASRPPAHQGPNVQQNAHISVGVQIGAVIAEVSGGGNGYATPVDEIKLLVFSLLSGPATNVRRFEASKRAGFQVVGVFLTPMEINQPNPVS
jgi:hypothetical protein